MTLQTENQGLRQLCAGAGLPVGSFRELSTAPGLSDLAASRPFMSEWVRSLLSPACLKSLILLKSLQFSLFMWLHIKIFKQLLCCRFSCQKHSKDTSWFAHLRANLHQPGLSSRFCAFTHWLGALGLHQYGQELIYNQLVHPLALKLWAPVCGVSHNLAHLRLPQHVPPLPRSATGTPSLLELRQPFEAGASHRVRPKYSSIGISGWFQITGCHAKPYRLTLFLKIYSLKKVFYSQILRE